MLIDGRGITMPLEQAVTKIAYRPYLPPASVLAFAVIPPLGGADIPANRGFAVEYTARGNALLLSQWPRHRLNVSFGGSDISGTPCTIVQYSPNAVAWSSHRGFVLTLQPDGNVPQSEIDAEAKRLIASGACK